MTTPPGWYADPTIGGQLRYWDGTAWTEHRSPTTGHGLVPYGGNAAVPYNPHDTLPLPMPAQQPPAPAPYPPPGYYAAPRAAVVMSRKSPGLAFLLAFLFGAFGLFYVSGKAGGVAVAAAVILALGMFTIVLAPFIWIGAMIYAPIAASNINARIDRAERMGIAVI